MAKLNFIRSILALMISVLCLNGYAQTYPFRDTCLSDQERITNLLSLMTLEEKIDYMASRQPGIPRLGIPKNRCMEGIHGLAYNGVANWAAKGEEAAPTTIFPQAIGLAQTWDVDLVERVAAQEAYESRYLTQHPDYEHAGLIIRSPVLDLGRDARWGRLEECYGEDPFLAAELGMAFVRGLQGNHYRYWKTASLLKHFIGNNNENNRYTVSADFNEHLFREYYGYPFYKAITDAGAHSVMMAYNKYNDIPATVHPVIHEVLIDEWNLKGIICTDGGAFRRLVDAHHYYESYTDAAAGCIKAGINMFLDDYKPYVREALENEMISERDIDKVLSGVLWTNLKLGLLDAATNNPYTNIGVTDTIAPWETFEARKLAREAVKKSIVLLKNQGQLLPLNKNDIRSIAVIGPYANTVVQDWYSGMPPYNVTILEAIKNKLGPNVKVNYAASNKNDSAIIAAQTSEIAIVCIGNHPLSYGLDWGKNYVYSDGREEVDRQALTLEQEDLVKLIHKYNPNTLLMLVSSFPYTINWSKENIPVILHVTHSGQELGNGVADVLFGDYNPSAKLVLTWPKSITDLPPITDYDITNNRTYMYSKADPLYPFGFGLSYTTFDYSNLAVAYSNQNTIDISFDIANSGIYDGEEVVQVYIQYPHEGLSQNVKSLNGFEKVKLSSSTSKTLHMSVAMKDLPNIIKNNEKRKTKNQYITILIGSSSEDIRLKNTLELNHKIFF